MHTTKLPWQHCNAVQQGYSVSIIQLVLLTQDGDQYNNYHEKGKKVFDDDWAKRRLFFFHDIGACRTGTAAAALLLWGSLIATLVGYIRADSLRFVCERLAEFSGYGIFRLKRSLAEHRDAWGDGRQVTWRRMHLIGFLIDLIDFLTSLLVCCLICLILQLDGIACFAPGGYCAGVAWPLTSRLV